VDSLRRVITADENDAQEMSEFFTDTVRPLSKKYGISWIFIHHLRKGISGRNPTDIMDELRGSSELANYADVVLISERPRGSNDRVVLRQAKCRRALEIPSELIQINWGENNVGFESIGTAEEIINSIDLCGRDVIIWTEEKQIKSFNTNDVKEEFKEKYSRATLTRALAQLVQQGKLSRLKRGCYQRITEDLSNFINEESKTQKAQES